MSSARKKLVALLEERFGVRPEFAGHLAPVLERFAAQEPTNEEWEQALSGVAAAYNVLREPDPRTSQEIRVLVGEFLSELRKIDESLKVVSVYLDRIRGHLHPGPSNRIIH